MCRKRKEEDFLVNRISYLANWCKKLIQISCFIIAKESPLHYFYNAQGSELATEKILLLRIQYQYVLPLLSWLIYQRYDKQFNLTNVPIHELNRSDFTRNTPSQFTEYSNLYFAVGIANCSKSGTFCIVYFSPIFILI